MRTIAGLGAFLVLFLAIGAGWVVNCSGPRPQVESVRLLEPESEDHPYRVEAEVRNQGRNGGEVSVVFELIGSDGAIYRAKQNYELEEHETLRAVAEIEAPRGSYEPRVKALYPPD